MLLQIKLMSVYSRETHQYGGCNQLSRSRASSLDLVKSVIESPGVPIKRSNLLFVLDLEIIFIVSNNIDWWWFFIEVVYSIASRACRWGSDGN